MAFDFSEGKGNPSSLPRSVRRLQVLWRKLIRYALPPIHSPAHLVVLINAVGECGIFRARGFSGRFFPSFL